MSSFDDVNFKVEKDCAEEQKWEIVPEELSPTLKNHPNAPHAPILLSAQSSLNIRFQVDPSIYSLID